MIKKQRNNFMKRKNNKLQEAFLAKREAKNKFLEIANNKESNIKEILDAYKNLRKKDDHLMSIYEGITYDKSA